MNPSPQASEEHLSKVPALQVLSNLGWRYLPAEAADVERRGRRGNVVLEGILEAQLRVLNRVAYRGVEYPFTDATYPAAINALKQPGNEGLIRENEKLYDLISLGKSFEQTIEGNTRSYSLHYVDWERPERNVFHVVEEFAVERTASTETLRPDLVLFVNGLPLVVIECKKPGRDKAIEVTIAQHLRNQHPDGIPELFRFSQVLLALTTNEARYATAGTKREFWSEWHEEDEDVKTLRSIANGWRHREDREAIFSNRPAEVREYFDALERAPREVTEQDRLLVHLCTPARLLEMARQFVLFDAGEKKIARYQQYFAVQHIMKRVREKEPDGRRAGGIVWHTQGSGKSLTMVMLAKSLALASDIIDPRIVLVTDRVDLDEQIWGTFRSCGTEPVMAKSGANLLELLQRNKATIITTIIHKFDAAVSGRRDALSKSDNIFVLVDEAHRSQAGRIRGFSEFHTAMRRVMKDACYIGFTGTPLMKGERDTAQQFGGLIHTYTIDDAVADKAVVPLLYEGRHALQEVNKEAIDQWFDRVCEDLPERQQADLKRKFSATGVVSQAEQRLLAIAWDISDHFAKNWQGTPFKAQLVTPNKITAIKFKRFFDDIGKVATEVLISAPEEPEGGYENAYEKTPDTVVEFWNEMKARFGNERNYNQQLINSFKNDDRPEIIIVVDKLITGFDAPRNTVLYLARKLEGHSLLQAIARVNRLYPGKDYGYIVDYEGVLQNLDSALTSYRALAEFDAEDLGLTIVSVNEEVKKLPTVHRELWDVFAALPNRYDNEAYEQHLADDFRREGFYQKLSRYSRTLAIALSTLSFQEDTPPKTIRAYKDDLRYFQNLRAAVQKRYADKVDYAEYETKIRKLIDTHVTSGEVQRVTDLVSIFDHEAFSREVDKLKTPASKADTIAHRTLRTISEKMGEDPVFYQRFSDLIRDAIEQFRLQRIADSEYYRRVSEAGEAVRLRTGMNVPKKLSARPTARAFYGLVEETLKALPKAPANLPDLAADVALKIDDDARDTAKIVAWTENVDVQNKFLNRVEDHLLDLKKLTGLDFDFTIIDAILERALGIAKKNYGGS
ncbi:type I restriction endonuclease subunit R [Congregicoccus parvus]|uniref:type I restriction endonuclease subunit R n=1 Tax=Congregicoccus parvus TaxID=3081749 RepID=UPI003FA5F4FC